MIKWTKVPDWAKGMTEIDHIDGDYTNNDHDNDHDRHAKGRDAKGEQAGGAKLTEVQVHEILRRYSEGGVAQHTLANEFGIAQTNVSLIVNKKVWKHI